MRERARYVHAEERGVRREGGNTEVTEDTGRGDIAKASQPKADEVVVAEGRDGGCVHPQGEIQSLELRRAGEERERERDGVLWISGV